MSIMSGHQVNDVITCQWYKIVIISDFQWPSICWNTLNEHGLLNYLTLLY